ncbi:MAG TPA: hypothetical protein VNH46_02560, partial [Gemmatimonadales bacterium]|nr:hypothetical protein [Gemmatimonadales bacterium]
DADGTTRWLADPASHLDMSAGWDEFVTWGEPPHFSTLGQVTLRDADGIELWSLPVHYPSAAVAPDGSYIALAGVPDTATQSTWAPELSDIEYRVVARDGTLLVEGASPHGRILGVTADGTSFLLQDRDPDGTDRVAARGLGGEIAWQFPIPRYAIASFVRRLGLVVVADIDGLTGYR